MNASPTPEPASELATELAPEPASELATGPRRGMGYVLVAGAATSWGLWPLLLRWAESFGPMAPALESLVVMAVVTLATLPLALRDRFPQRPTRMQWAGLGLLGVSDAMNIALFFAAYRQTTVAIAVLSHYLTPILVALVAPRLVGEKGTPRSLVAMVLGFVGLALVLEPWRGQVQEGDRLGALLGAGSAVFYTANVMLQKRLAGAFTTNQVLAYHGFVAVPVLAMMVPQESLLHWDGRGMATLVLGALGPGALAGVAFLVGLRRIPASHASTLTFLEPLVAVLVGVLVFREPLGLWGILGSVGILVGGILVVTDRPAPAAEASIRGERSSQGVAK